MNKANNLDSNLFRLIESVIKAEVPKLLEQRIARKPVSVADVVLAAAKKPNKGDVAEGILGAAIVASLISPEKPVTYASVIRVLGQLNKNENKSKSNKIIIKSAQFTVPRNPQIRGSKNDVVTFTLGLAQNNFTNGLFNDEFLTTMQGIIGSAIKFANSRSIRGYALELYNNPKDNKIQVKSIGTENQKGTKVDLAVIEDGQQISWGAMSLKAGGTKQLGQTGKRFNNPEETGSRGIANLFNSLFGVNLDLSLENMYVKAINSKDRRQIIKAIILVYKNAELKINERFGGDQDELIDLLKTLARGIRHEATLNEEGVILVHLDDKDFKVLDFKKLVEMMDDDTLPVEIGTDLKLTNGGIPYLYIWMTVNDIPYGNIISIRPKIAKSGEFRHYVEKEAGLVKLIQLSDF
jgi:hypothetical protein